MPNSELFSVTVKAGRGALLPAHYHEDALEFIEVVKGRVTVTVGLSSVEVPEGGILHLLPGAVHYATSADGEECYLRAITYRRGAVFAAPGLDEQFFSLYVLPIENRAVLYPPEHPLHDTLSAHMENAIAEWEGKELFYTALVLSELSHMLTAILRFYSYRDEESLDYRNKMRVAPAVRYIEASYAQKLRLEDLAATLYLSPDHFGKLFRSAVGLTPVEYVNHVRINAAMCRLAVSDASITEVAADSGFANANYFHKVFRDLVGQGPAALRKQWRVMCDK
ncbi:MAG: helix-turn-helix transcriptional regulator [Clostridia bacterium]|nr:helix-turn-helix transcriptional regulator [Clostridia bacterium]